MKNYLQGPDPSIRIPVREIALSDGTVHTVYDTSGPYSDANYSVGYPPGSARAARAVDRGAQRHDRPRQSNVDLSARTRSDAGARRRALSEARTGAAREERTRT